MSFVKVQTFTVTCDNCGNNLNSDALSQADAERVATQSAFKLAVTAPRTVSRTGEVTLCDHCARGVLVALRSALPGLNSNWSTKEKGAVASGKTAAPADVSESAKVRAWARDNGLTVGDRGKIAPEVLKAYATREVEASETISA